MQSIRLQKSLKVLYHPLPKSPHLFLGLIIISIRITEESGTGVRPTSVISPPLRRLYQHVLGVIVCGWNRGPGRNHRNIIFWFRVCRWKCVLVSVSLWRIWNQIWKSPQVTGELLHDDLSHLFLIHVKPYLILKPKRAWKPGSSSQKTSGYTS